MALASATQTTFFFERWRAVAAGIIETAGSSFLLLIAVRHFEAGATAKAMVAGGGSLGFALSPMIVSFVARAGWPASIAAARLAFVGAITFLVMALVPGLPVFVLGSMLGMTTSNAAIPLLTQMYQENYPARQRGNLFSRAFIIRIGTAALFGELVGRFLTGNIEHFRYLLLVFSAAFACAGHCLGRCPSTPLTVTGGTHPLRSLRFVREDALFRRTLVSWMLMGFANLMMLPMRVELLANEKHGLALSVGEVAFLTVVVPNAARLVMSPVWGWLFDRMNFFALRVTLNAGFAIGILSFFTSSDITGLILGSVVYGIAIAGGDIAWGLWVTKFSPPEHVADYMSVHTFFNGLRGLAAPLAAFHLVKTYPPSTLGWISAALILGASLLLIPEIGMSRAVRKGSPVVEDASD